jgi:hypothetical protein
MILSCLITANSRLAIAAAEMTARMVNFNRAEVLATVCFDTWGIG